jgi:hypothetical protein
MIDRKLKRRAFDMTFEKIKDEKVAALVEAAQDCGHYSSVEDLENDADIETAEKGGAGPAQSP